MAAHRGGLLAVLRGIAGYAVVAVVVLPLAVADGITRTEVHDTIGVLPTTFTVATGGHSELRLGIAGTVYLPVSRGPFGLVAAVDGPVETDADPSASGDLASFVSPQLLALYAGIFHDPGAAVRGYVDVVRHELVHRTLLTELWLTLLVGTTVLLVGRVLPVRSGLSHPRLRVVALVVGALVTTCALGAAEVSRARPPTPADTFPLTALDGTAAAGATTNSPVLRLLLGGAVPKVQTLVRRQERDAQAFRDTATGQLLEQRPLMTGPRDGETAVLMQSDMHCNQVMIRLQREVRRQLEGLYGAGVPALMAITGDLTTNGTAAENSCIDEEDAIAGEAPVAAVTGNHESELSAQHMAAAGMEVLDGEVREVGGVRVLGAGDPERSELFGASRLRGSESQEEVGTRLRATAERKRPDLVLVHEAYAAQAFLGVEDITSFLESRGSPTEPGEDGVADVPASAVFYGHWHRQIEPRVVWNDDGTWTLVMELDTSGGAIDTPTLGHFSTPWTSPQQEASFPVVFLDRASGLVTGYQLYSFSTQGEVTVRPRVDVGVRPPGAPTVVPSLPQATPSAGR